MKKNLDYLYYFGISILFAFLIIGLDYSAFATTVTIGGNTGTQIASAGNIYVEKVTGLPTGDNIVSVGIDQNPAAGNIRVKVYNDLSGIPNTLLGESLSLSSNVNGWQDYNITTPVQVPSSGIVWIGFQTDQTSAFMVNRDTTTLQYYTGHAFTVGPNPFGATTNQNLGWHLRIITVQPTGPKNFTKTLSESIGLNDSIKVTPIFARATFSGGYLPFDFEITRIGDNSSLVLPNGTVLNSVPYSSNTGGILLQRALDYSQFFDHALRIDIVGNLNSNSSFLINKPVIINADQFTNYYKGPIFKLSFYYIKIHLHEVNETTGQATVFEIESDHGVRGVAYNDLQAYVHGCKYAMYFVRDSSSDSWINQSDINLNLERCQNGIYMPDASNGHQSQFVGNHLQIKTNIMNGTAIYFGTGTQDVSSVIEYDSDEGLYNPPGKDDGTNIAYKNLSSSSIGNDIILGYVTTTRSTFSSHDNIVSHN